MFHNGKNTANDGKSVVVPKDTLRLLQKKPGTTMIITAVQLTFEWSTLVEVVTLVVA